MMNDRQPSLERGEWGLLAFLLFCVLLTVYGTSLGNGFVALDDPYVIYSNLAIREISPATLRQIFTSYDPELYTPLTFFTFQLNHAIAGLEPWIYHATNLALHWMNSLLVTQLLLMLIGRRMPAILGGLLFALHPLNTEVVAWATARKEVLSAFFFLLSFIAYLKADGRSRGLYWTSVGSFLLALLSKVTVFVLPVILLLADWLRGRKADMAMLRDKIPYIVLSVVFVAIGLIPKAGILSSTTLSDKILMSARSTLFYLWKFIVPTGLSVLYPHSGPVSLASPLIAASVAGFLVLVAATAFSMRRTRTAAFGLLLFMAGIGPTFVHFNRNASIASGDMGGIQIASDHYLYLPMIGLIFITVTGLAALWNRAQSASIRTAVGTACTAVLLTFAVLSRLQAAHWQDSETLFVQTLKHYPHSGAARAGLSVAYRKSGRMAEEKRVLEEGLAYGENPKLLTGLGSIAARNGDYAKAEEYFSRALKADPSDAETHFSRGAMLSQQGKNDAALQSYAKAIAIDPLYAAVHNNMGSILLGRGDTAGAEAKFREAIRINPSLREGHFNLAALLRDSARRPEAARHFETAVLLDPWLHDARLELVPLYLEQGRNTDAFNQLKAVLADDPENATAKALVQEMVKLGIIGTKK